MLLNALISSLIRFCPFLHFVSIFLRVHNYVVATLCSSPVPIAEVVENPLREQEVVGSISGRAIPKALKMVPVATLLGAQHYKASTGFSSPNKYCN